jgi:hypothetical protein
MTSATSHERSLTDHLAMRATTSQTIYAPTTALLVSLLAAQCSGAVPLKSSAVDTRSSTQITSAAVDYDLFNELVEFHERLAGAQKALPEEAARVLRENLWSLYD